MTDYQKTKMYKIESDKGDKIYIGFTVREFENCFNDHLMHYKLWKEGKHNEVLVFQMFDAYGAENCRITLLEDFPCKSRTESNRRKEFHIKNIPCINREHQANMGVCKCCFRFNKMKPLTK